MASAPCHESTVHASDRATRIGVTMTCSSRYRTCTAVRRTTVSMLSLKLKQMPVGAEVVPEGVRFRVWAPRRSRVQVICDGHPPLPLARDGEYFTGDVSRRGPGTRYCVPARRRRSRLSGPGLALPAGRAARAFGGDRPVGVRLDRRRLAGHHPAADRCSTSCTSAPSRPRAPGRRPHASCRG